MSNELLTPRRLELPMALASRLARVGSHRWEELVSAGNLSLVVGASRYDAGHPSAAEPDTYLHACVSRGMWQKVYGSRHRAKWRHLVSLETPAGEQGEDGDGRTLADLYAVDGEPGPDEQASARELLDDALRTLDPRRREAVMLYYGHGLSAADIGRMMGFSRERARQLIDSGMARAKAAARARGLRNELASPAAHGSRNGDHKGAEIG